MSELRRRATLPLWPDTGEVLGMSRPATYAAAKRGDFPTIRVGSRILVPTGALLRWLGYDPDAPMTDDEPVAG